MATRVYLTNSAPGYTPPTKQGNWGGDSSSTVAGALIKSPSGASATSTISLAGDAAGGDDALLGRWISSPLDANITFTNGVDTWQTIFGVSESNAAADMVSHVHIYVTTGDTDTPRGTLVLDSIASPLASEEWPLNASRAGNLFNNSSTNSLSTVAAQTGDRIVVEIGFNIARTTSVAYAGTMNYGVASGTDLTDTSTNVTTEPGWIEFSTNGLFLPSISSASVSDGGRDFDVPSQEIAVSFSEAVKKNSGSYSVGNTILGLTCQINGGANQALTYVSGETTASWVVKTANLIKNGDTVVLDYDQATGELFDNATNTSELKTTTDASVTNNLTKRVTFTVKDKNNSLVLNEVVKFGIFQYDSGTVANANWMALDNGLKSTPTTNSSTGRIDVEYTGASAVGATVYVVVIRPNTSPTESMIWTTTIT